MTMWAPDLGGATGPKYLAIAEAIERGIAAEQLAPGARLPAQRDLARQLGVTVGTVGRGYAEARRRGLLSGEVGRGTFVRPPAGANGFGLAHGEASELVNFAHNAPHFAGLGELLRDGLAGWSSRGEFLGALGYQSHAGSPRHRRLGAEWMRRFGFAASPEETVVTTGAQHAMLVALSALVEPGDLVLAEALAYPGVKAVARFLGLRLEGVAVDEHGIVPDAFDEACRRASPVALYCTPNLQNPTATIAPEDRRRQLAAIAERHAVTIVEDDTYGFLVDAPPPPLSTLTGARSLYLTSLSKSVAPGLRIGFLHAPTEVLERVSDALMTTAIMASPLAAELAATLIENGTADEVSSARRRDVRSRHALARQVLGPHIAAGVRPESPHVWLNLPDPWRAEEFATQARTRGIAVAPAEAFAVGRAAAPHAVRISLSAVPDNATLERGLAVLAELLASPPAPRFAGP